MSDQLVSLTLLSTQWEKYNLSYLDNFVPLFATFLIKENKNSFTKKDFCLLANEFTKFYGLPLPAYLLSAIVVKLYDNKLINKEHDTYIVLKDNIIDNGFLVENEIKTYEINQKKLLDRFIGFCSNKYSYVINAETAKRIILSFIKENDSEIFLENYVNEKNESTVDEQFLISKFISTMFIEDYEIYKYFVEFAVGNIALKALYLTPPGALEQSLKNCVFFLDSSYIFPLLEIDSEQKKSVIEDLLIEIKDKGAKVKIFQHTYEEIDDILTTSLEYIESIDYDPQKANKALSYMRQEGFSKTRVELIKASVPKVLDKYNITVDKQTGKSLGINEKNLFDKISDNLKLKTYERKDYYNTRTLRDVNSIIFTYERRKKIVSKNFKDARYSFITENALLTKSDKEIVYQYIDKPIDKKDFFPSAIPEYLLTSYLFLGSAKKAVINLNFSVLATSLAAIKPSPELEFKLREKAKELLSKGSISEEEFIIITANHLIKDSLADKTLGVAENLTDDTIFSLIEDAKDQLAIEEREKNKILTSQLTKKMEQDNKRREKAYKRATYKAIPLYILETILLLLPYIVSAFSLIKKYFIAGIIIFIIWSLFCFFINHVKSINIKKIWKKTFKNQLQKAFEYFEIEFN